MQYLPSLVFLFLIVPLEDGMEMGKGEVLFGTTLSDLGPSETDIFLPAIFRV